MALVFLGGVSGAAASIQIRGLESLKPEVTPTSVELRPDLDARLKAAHIPEPRSWSSNWRAPSGGVMDASGAEPITSGALP